MPALVTIGVIVVCVGILYAACLWVLTQIKWDEYKREREEDHGSE
jgi:hypothetical protein